MPSIQSSKSDENVFAAGTLYRASESRLDEQQINRLLDDPAVRFVPVWKNKHLVIQTNPVQPVFLARAAAEPLLNRSLELVFLGFLAEVPYFALALPEDPVPEVFFPPDQAFKDLREIGALLGKDEGSMLAYARAMMHWHYTHQYCGRCGNKTISAEAGHVRKCPNPACGLKHFPRTDAAIIVLITYQQHCLLVRQPNWPEKMHATVAGFLEPGESLEDAVAREVMEETGLELTNIRYHSSQPWPFPASIMVGFTAQATSMDFRLDQREIEQACWLTRPELIRKLKDNTIKIPSPLSISYRLLEDWFKKKNRGVLSQIR
jgi:NAD+ diphosphatase